MQGGCVPQGGGLSRIVSSSRGLHVGQVLRPASDGSRQSLCPAKFAALSWLTQSHTVVIAPKPAGSTSHVPLHVLHPTVPPWDAQVAAAAAFG